MAVVRPCLYRLLLENSIPNSQTHQIQTNSLCLCTKHFRKYSSNWRRRQEKDIFFKQAKMDGWRCRSAYKLLEMQSAYNIMKPGDVVIDLGAAPGSWSQVAVQVVRANEIEPKKRGQVFCVDLLKMEPIPGAVIFDETDFTSKEFQQQLAHDLQRKKVGVILSDMAPNATGHHSHDQKNLMSMCASVLRFSTLVLSRNGHVLVKVWMGSDLNVLELGFKKLFKRVYRIKPSSSRSESAEIYILGKYFNTPVIT